MDTFFFTLACWLLALSFAVPPTEKPTTQGLTETNAITDVTSSNASVPVTVITTPTKDTTTLTSTTGSHTFTKNTPTTAETTEHLQTFQSTTTETYITNSSSVTATETETPGTQTPPLTVLTTPIALTTSYISSSDTTVITTADLSTVNITSQSVHTTKHGLGLNTAERSLTIVFCCILGVCAVVLLLFMFHRCKHKLQFVHQPLNNTDSTGDAFTTDDDTLVISGGLYDGHPIYDNVPTPRTDESHFRLEFLH